MNHSCGNQIEKEEVSKQEEENFIFHKPLYQLKLECSQETVYATTDTLEVKTNQYVIAATRYGNDLVRVMGEITTPLNTTPSDIVKIIRIASEVDIEKSKENQKKEKEAKKTFLELVQLHNLDMKFIACHFLLEDSKALFFFSAESRINFRNLVKDLVSIFKIRVELRQIGVRDEARMKGGLGCCGRALCCHQVSDRLKPVSIKMAKDQNLSLNSIKISGQCGRLLCCLSFESEWYNEAKQKLPTERTTVYYDNTLFRITEVNSLTEMVSFSGDDGRFFSIPVKKMTNLNGKWQILDLDL